MKALYFDGKELHLKTDYPKPIPLPNEALIKVSLAGICNTDKEILQGYKGFKGVLGHEFVGVVHQSKEKYLIGKTVVAEINFGCGKCSVCLAGFQKHCHKRKILGIKGKDGIFAEYVTIPIKNLCIVPKTIEDRVAVFVEPLASIINIIEKNHIKPSEKIAILGDGKLAQLAVRVIATTLCDLTIIGKHKEKLILAKKFAKTEILNENIYENKFDITIDCTGSGSGLNYAQKITTPEGLIILKSTYASEISLNPTIWVVKELRIFGSRCGNFAPVLRMLKKHDLQITDLISKIYKLENYRQAFAKNTLKQLFSF